MYSFKYFNLFLVIFSFYGCSSNKNDSNSSLKKTSQSLKTQEAALEELANKDWFFYRPNESKITTLIKSIEGEVLCQTTQYFTRINNVKSLNESTKNYFYEFNLYDIPRNSIINPNNLPECSLKKSNISEYSEENSGYTFVDNKILENLNYQQKIKFLDIATKNIKFDLVCKKNVCKFTEDTLNENSVTTIDFNFNNYSEIIKETITKTNGQKLIKETVEELFNVNSKKIDSYLKNQTEEIDFVKNGKVKETIDDNGVKQISIFESSTPANFNAIIDELKLTIY